jgi:Icc-related predicted phosphoesterase
MKVVAISDLQGQCVKVKPEMLPPADILIIAGDLTNLGTVSELAIFDSWLGTLSYRYKLYCAGNHDLGLARTINGRTFFKHGTYLENELIEIEGLKIYGSPISECGEYAPYWEFCNESYIERVVENIPQCDILVTHGPAYGTLDSAPSDLHIGSKVLLDRLNQIKPQAHIFGHCHLSYGKLRKDGVLFINGALCNEDNQIVDQEGTLLRQPIVFDI